MDSVIRGGEAQKTVLQRVWITNYNSDPPFLNFTYLNSGVSPWQGAWSEYGLMHEIEGSWKTGQESGPCFLASVPQSSTLLVNELTVDNWGGLFKVACSFRKSHWERSCDFLSISLYQESHQSSMGLGEWCLGIDIWNCSRSKAWSGML